MSRRVRHKRAGALFPCWATTMRDYPISTLPLCRYSMAVLEQNFHLGIVPRHVYENLKARITDAMQRHVEHQAPKTA